MNEINETKEILEKDLNFYIIKIKSLDEINKSYEKKITSLTYINDNLTNDLKNS